MKHLTLFLCAITLFLAGCQPSTKMYRDGFRSIQITKIPPSWDGLGKEFITYCMSKQEVKHTDGQYYCPPDNTAAGLNSAYEPVMASSNYAGLVVPSAIQAAGLITMGGLISHGLQHNNAARMTQSAVQSNSGIGSAYISTLNTPAGPIPGLPNGK